MLLAAPAIVYLAVLSANTVNIPTGDDLPALFNFLEQWQNPGPDGRSYLGLLFEQFYSHRIPFTRLIVVGQTSLQGHCDLRLLLGVAWAGWLLLLASLVWSRWSLRYGMPWMLPVSLFLMQPQGQTNLLVATGSPGHSWTILLAFWACHFARAAALSRQAWALVLAAGSALCTANGLLLFPVFAAGEFFRREWRRGFLWLGVGVVAWGWYLRGYSVTEQPFAQHGFSPWSFIQNAAVMTGAVVNFGTVSLAIVTAAGLALLLAAGLTWWRGRRDDQGGGDGAFLLFLLLSIAMTAYARIGWGASYMLQDRYRLYGLLIITMLYLRCAREVAPPRRTGLVVGSVIAALGFGVFSYAQGYANLLFTRRWSEAAAMNLAFNRSLPLPSAPDQAASASEILQKAVQHGNLRPPRLLNQQDLETIRNLPRSSLFGVQSSWRCIASSDVSGYVLEPEEDPAPAAPDFGVLFQDGKPLVLSVNPQRPRFSEILPRRSFLSDRYTFVLPGNAYAPGRHALYAIKRRADGTIAAIWSAAVTCP